MLDVTDMLNFLVLSSIIIIGVQFGERNSKKPMVCQLSKHKNRTAFSAGDFLQSYNL